ncbi:pseudouridine synthase [Clostridium oryzae]|uniref:Pseudouridine synthase n=1 Tax=Clostridium oryzae TaxID=1450648 RepID=A0A1V4IBY7_9CLOT|nr:pseudouridine synthase [Clostridium oryzae]OPJ57390.1 ribosomal large subunit pseudouridine synthase B [Clostridium oryzae]
MERLQKYMARCGVASRRKCEELILNGKVKVNGIVVTELGTKINESEDEVLVSNKRISPVKDKIYIMLNKPCGYVSTVKDERGRPTIIDLIDINERIYPIGRLDYDTSGLILLTNDGDIYNKIIHPRKEVNKVYLAKLRGKLTGNKISRFENGVDIGGYITAKSEISIIKENTESTDVKITIHEGKNRQIRKMCEAIGNPVISLKRISISNLSLGSLPQGKWRYLTDKELKDLIND